MKIWGQKGRNNLYNNYFVEYFILNETELNVIIKGNTTKELTEKYYEVYCKNKKTSNIEVFYVGIEEAKLIAKDLKMELPPVFNLYYNETLSNSKEYNDLQTQNSKMSKVAHNTLLALNIMKKSIIYKNYGYKNIIDLKIKEIYINNANGIHSIIKTINTILNNQNLYLNNIIKNIINYEKIHIDYNLLINELSKHYKGLQQHIINNN